MRPRDHYQHHHRHWTFFGVAWVLVLVWVGSCGVSAQGGADFCDSNPCLNKARCFNFGSSYICICAHGFTGPNCETEINECASDPCLNGGTCFDYRGFFYCLCPDGFGGTRCELDNRPCSSDPCQNGANCTNALDQLTFMCDCPVGYTGLTCSEDIQECDSSPCLNGAVCIDEINGYRCECAAGWTDPFCGTDINECVSQPCVNGGTCIDNVGSYECQCDRGWTDTNCQTAWNVCEVLPCLNGATCIDFQTFGICICMPGYSGVICQNGPTTASVTTLTPTTMLSTTTATTPPQSTTNVVTTPRPTTQAMTTQPVQELTTIEQMASTPRVVATTSAAQSTLGSGSQTTAGSFLSTMAATTPPPQTTTSVVTSLRPTTEAASTQRVQELRTIEQMASTPRVVATTSAAQSTLDNGSQTTAESLLSTTAATTPPPQTTTSVVTSLRPTTEAASTQRVQELTTIEQRAFSPSVTVTTAADQSTLANGSQTTEGSMLQTTLRMRQSTESLSEMSTASLTSRLLSTRDTNQQSVSPSTQPSSGTAGVTERQTPPATELATEPLSVNMNASTLPESSTNIPAGGSTVDSVRVSTARQDSTTAFSQEPVTGSQQVSEVPNQTTTASSIRSSAASQRTTPEAVTPALPQTTSSAADQTTRSEVTEAQRLASTLSLFQTREVFFTDIPLEVTTRFIPVFTTLEEAMLSSAAVTGNFTTIEEVTTLAAEVTSRSLEDTTGYQHETESSQTTSVPQDSTGMQSVPIVESTVAANDSIVTMFPQGTTAMGGRGSTATLEATSEAGDLLSPAVSEQGVTSINESTTVESFSTSVAEEGLTPEQRDVTTVAERTAALASTGANVQTGGLTSVVPPATGVPNISEGPGTTMVATDGLPALTPSTASEVTSQEEGLMSTLADVSTPEVEESATTSGNASFTSEESGTKSVTGFEAVTEERSTLGVESTILPGEGSTVGGVSTQGRFMNSTAVDTSTPPEMTGLPEEGTSAGSENRSTFVEVTTSASRTGNGGSSAAGEATSFPEATSLVTQEAATVGASQSEGLATDAGMDTETPESQTINDQTGSETTAFVTQGVTRRIPGNLGDGTDVIVTGMASQRSTEQTEEGTEEPTQNRMSESSTDLPGPTGEIATSVSGTDSEGLTVMGTFEVQTPSQTTKTGASTAGTTFESGVTPSISTPGDLPRNSSVMTVIVTRATGGQTDAGTPEDITPEAVSTLTPIPGSPNSTTVDYEVTEAARDITTAEATGGIASTVMADKTARPITESVTQTVVSGFTTSSVEDTSDNDVTVTERITAQNVTTQRVTTVGDVAITQAESTEEATSAGTSRAAGGASTEGIVDFSTAATELVTVPVSPSVTLEQETDSMQTEDLSEEPTEAMTDLPTTLGEEFGSTDASGGDITTIEEEVSITSSLTTLPASDKPVDLEQTTEGPSGIYTGEFSTGSPTAEPERTNAVTADITLREESTQYFTTSYNASDVTQDVKQQTRPVQTTGLSEEITEVMTSILNLATGEDVTFTVTPSFTSNGETSVNPNESELTTSIGLTDEVTEMLSGVATSPKFVEMTGDQTEMPTAQVTRRMTYTTVIGTQGLETDIAAAASTDVTMLEEGTASVTVPSEVSDVTTEGKEVTDSVQTTQPSKGFSEIASTIDVTRGNQNMNVSLPSGEATTSKEEGSTSTMQSGGTSGTSEEPVDLEVTTLPGEAEETSESVTVGQTEEVTDEQEEQTEVYQNTAQPDLLTSDMGTAEVTSVSEDTVPVSVSDSTELPDEATEIIESTSVTIEMSVSSEEATAEEQVLNIITVMPSFTGGQASSRMPTDLQNATYVGATEAAKEEVSTTALDTSTDDATFSPTDEQTGGMTTGVEESTPSTTVPDNISAGTQGMDQETVAGQTTRLASESTQMMSEITSTTSGAATSISTSSEEEATTDLEVTTPSTTIGEEISSQTTYFEQTTGVTQTEEITDTPSVTAPVPVTEEEALERTTTFGDEETFTMTTLEEFSTGVKQTPGVETQTPISRETVSVTEAVKQHNISLATTELPEESTAEIVTSSLATSSNTSATSDELITTNEVNTRFISATPPDTTGLGSSRKPVDLERTTSIDEITENELITTQEATTFGEDFDMTTSNEETVAITTSKQDATTDSGTSEVEASTNLSTTSVPDRASVTESVEEQTTQVQRTELAEESTEDMTDMHSARSTGVPLSSEELTTEDKGITMGSTAPYLTTIEDGSQEPVDLEQTTSVNTDEVTETNSGITLVATTIEDFEVTTGDQRTAETAVPVLITDGKKQQTISTGTTQLSQDTTQVTTDTVTEPEEPISATHPSAEVSTEFEEVTDVATEPSFTTGEEMSSLPIDLEMTTSVVRTDDATETTLATISVPVTDFEDATLKMTEEQTAVMTTQGQFQTSDDGVSEEVASSLPMITVTMEERTPLPGDVSVVTEERQEGTAQTTEIPEETSEARTQMFSTGFGVPSTSSSPSEELTTENQGPIFTSTPSGVGGEETTEVDVTEEQSIEVTSPDDQTDAMTKLPEYTTSETSTPSGIRTMTVTEEHTPLMTSSAVSVDGETEELTVSMETTGFVEETTELMSEIAFTGSEVPTEEASTVSSTPVAATEEESSRKPVDLEQTTSRTEMSETTETAFVTTLEDATDDQDLGATSALTEEPTVAVTTPAEYTTSEQGTQTAETNTPRIPEESTETREITSAVTEISGSVSLPSEELTTEEQGMGVTTPGQSSAPSEESSQKPVDLDQTTSVGVTEEATKDVFTTSLRHTTGGEETTVAETDEATAVDRTEETTQNLKGTTDAGTTIELRQSSKVPESQTTDMTVAVEETTEMETTLQVEFNKSTTPQTLYSTEAVTDLRDLITEFETQEATRDVASTTSQSELTTGNEMTTEQIQTSLPLMDGSTTETDLGVTTVDAITERMTTFLEQYSTGTLQVSTEEGERLSTIEVMETTVRGTITEQSVATTDGFLETTLVVEVTQEEGATTQPESGTMLAVSTREVVASTKRPLATSEATTPQLDVTTASDDLTTERAVSSQKPNEATTETGGEDTTEGIVTTDAPPATTEELGATSELLELTTIQQAFTTSLAGNITDNSVVATEEPFATTEGELATTEQLLITSEESLLTTDALLATTKEALATRREVATTELDIESTTANAATTEGELATTDSFVTTEKVLITSAESLLTTDALLAITKETLATRQEVATTELDIKSTTTNAATTEGELATTDSFVTTEKLLLTSAESLLTTDALLATTKEALATRQGVATTEVDIESTTADVATTEGVLATTEQLFVTSEESLLTTDALLGTTKEAVATTQGVATTEVDIESTTADVATTVEQSFTTQEIILSTKKEGGTTRMQVATTPGGNVTTNAPKVATTESGPAATTDESFDTTQESVMSTEDLDTTKVMLTTEAVMPSTPDGRITTQKNMVTTVQDEATTEEDVATTKPEAATTIEGVTTRVPHQTTESMRVTTRGDLATTEEQVGTTRAQVATTRLQQFTTKAEVPPTTDDRRMTTRELIATTDENIATTETEVETTREQVVTTKIQPTTEGKQATTGGHIATTDGGVATTQQPPESVTTETLAVVTTVESVATTKVQVPTTRELLVTTEAKVPSTMESQQATTEGRVAITNGGVATTQQPPNVVTTETQAVVTTGESVATTKVQVPTTREQLVTTEAKVPPTAESQQTTTQGHVVTTDSGVATTQQPPKVVTTESQPVTTMQPVITTRQPIATTKDQAPTTREQLVTTEARVPTTTQGRPLTTLAAKATTQDLAATTAEEAASTARQEATTMQQVVTTRGSRTSSTSPTTRQQNVSSTVQPTTAGPAYVLGMQATAAIIEINGKGASVTPELGNKDSEAFMNFQADLCNSLIEYFQDLFIDTSRIRCRVTNVVNGSIIASIRFNISGAGPDDVIPTAIDIFNAQITSDTFIIDSVSRNVFTLSSFSVEAEDTCGLMEPCLNGGTCLGSGFNDFSCVCRDGYTGETCEEALLLVLDVVMETDTEISVAWTYPQDDLDLVAFVMEYRQTNTDDWTLTTLLSRDWRRYTISGLEPDTAYFIRLLAFYITETRVVSLQAAGRTAPAEPMLAVDTQGTPNTTPSVLIWILVVVAMVALILFIVVVSLARRRHRESHTLPFKEPRWYMGANDNVAYDFETHPGPPSPPSVSAMALGMDGKGAGGTQPFWQIPREKLVVGNVKQSGRFGVLHFGKVLMGRQTLAVDVKKQRAPADKSSMMSELAILSQAGRHANVLNLIGACTTSGPVYLAFESMEPVRLDVYLRTLQDVHKPVGMHTPDFNITTPLMPLLMKFAVDTASGLSHLASKRIVQHSLGVRNIALTVNLVAKVTDFSIRDEPPRGRLVNGDTEGQGSTAPLPAKARWMSYETLVFSTYTEKSTVWSLGVILWEIFSYGREPFDEYQPEELSRKLTEGYTLKQPEGCLDDVYEIIQSCLRLEAEERPTIRMLVARLVRRLQSVKPQDKELRAEIFQALAQLSDNHDNMSPPQIRSMEMLVNSSIGRELAQARLMAVQYAATAFPGNHIASKYILLTACGDEIEVVRTEATNIIKTQARMAEMDMDSDAPTGKRLPPFTLMINFIRQKAFDNLPMSSQKSQGPLGVYTIPFKAAVYEKLTVYLRMCLAHSAGVSPNAFNTRDMMRQGATLGRFVNELWDMYAGEAEAPIPTYVGLLRQYVSAVGGGRGLYSLLEVVAMAPDKLAQQFVKKVDSLKMLLHSDEEAVRLYAAQLIGIVLCYAPPSLVVDSITSFNAKLEMANLESCQAMLWALGYIIGRQMQKEILANRDTFSRLTDTWELGENIYRRATEHIVAKLDSNSPTVVKAACTALAEIARNGPMPLPKGGKTNGKGALKGSSESTRSKSSNGSGGGHGPTKLSLVQRLGEVLNSESALFLLEVKKEAALALAHLMVGEADFPYRKLVLEALHKSVQIPTPSREQLLPFHFHMADCLATALQGPEAPAALDPWLEDTATLPLGQATPTNGDLVAIVQAMMDTHRKTNNSDEKEAIEIMLTVLFEQFRHAEIVQPHVPQMTSIIKQAVAGWEASGVIPELSSELQRRILRVLKLTRGAADPITPTSPDLPPYPTLPLQEAGDSLESGSGSGSGTGVYPDLPDSSSPDMSSDTGDYEAIAALDITGNEEDELTSL